MEISLEGRKPQIRRLSEIKNVVLDQEWLKQSQDLEVYYMYRAVEEKDGLRFDVTIIPPLMMGKEFVKTKGHSHVEKEVYTVLEGECIYLLQKTDGNKVKDVYAVKVKAGQSVVLPSSYGHVTINPSKDKVLKMANWISKNHQSDYSLYENMKGACYYYTEQGWIKNNNYQDIPELRFENPLNSIPENLDFLK